MEEAGLNDAATGMRAPRMQVVAGFAAVYLIWGSTFLAIRFAIETLPPFLMAAVRFLIAGGLLYGWTRLRGAARPTRAHWRGALIVGALLLAGGNGAVVWAEQRLPSGIAALLVAVVPCWMVLVEWLRPGGVRPTKQVVAGLMLGLAGIVLLVGPASLMGGEPVDPLGALAIMAGALAWAVGSIYTRHGTLHPRPLVATGMQMLCGGACLVVAAAATGEIGEFHPGGLSVRSALALLYLIAIGAIVGYTAYIWLLRVSTPARVSTYAYVNPVVAVLLGWAFAGEQLTPRMGIAAAVIVGGVALITLARPVTSRRGRDSASKRRRQEAARPET